MFLKLLCLAGFHDLRVIPDPIDEGRIIPFRRKCSRCNSVYAASYLQWRNDGSPKWFKLHEEVNNA